MLIGKYIFVIFLSLFIIRSFRGMGFGSGRQGRTKTLKFDIFPAIFAKRVVFLVSSGENVILPLLAAIAKYFWPAPKKSTIGPFLEKILPAAMFRGTRSSIEMLKGYTDGESLGTPGINRFRASLLAFCDCGASITILCKYYYDCNAQWWV